MTERITVQQYREKVAASSGRGSRRAGRRRQARDYKVELLNGIKLAGLPTPSTEFCFALPDRRWRWDFAYQSYRVAVEYQGAVFDAGQGGHHSVTGLTRDYEKFTEGQIRGWIVVMVTAQTVRNGQAVAWIERALMARGWQSGGDDFGK